MLPWSATPNAPPVRWHAYAPSAKNGTASIAIASG
jgi:hypothetical protein